MSKQEFRVNDQGVKGLDWKLNKLEVPYRRKPHITIIANGVNRGKQQNEKEP